MSENQYDAPTMEVVEFGKEDAVCTASPDDSGIDFGPGVNGGVFKIVCVRLATRDSDSEEQRHANA